MSAEAAIVDFETASELDVTDVGAWRYAEHPSTRILCLGYRMPHSAARRVWRPGEPFSHELQAHIDAGRPLEAHNAQFERAIWWHCLHLRMGFPLPPLRWEDTMAVCAYKALPLKLERVGEILDLDVQKDKRGKALLNMFSLPQTPKKEQLFAWAKQHGFQPELTKKGTEKVPAVAVLETYIKKIGKPHPQIWLTAETNPIEFAELLEYCMTDCDTEFHLGDMLGPLPPSEQRIWVFDQTINQRGVRIDIEAIHSALHIISIVDKEMTAELRELMQVPDITVGCRDQILTWVQKNGVPWLDNLQSDTIDEVLKRKDIPSHTMRVLEIRQELGGAAIKKLPTMLEWVCADERIRGMLQYHAASTGRWAGRGPQPQNLKRPDEAFIKMFGKDWIEILIHLIKSREPELLRLATGKSPLEVIASAMRGMFIAAEGHDFLVADFAAIEGVVTAWLAGEQWKIDAFRGIQAKKGYNGSEDIYCATAAAILGRPVNKKDHPDDRQTYGKIPELAFGYQGGVGAWNNFDSRGVLSEDEINEIKDNWRAKHPATVELWAGLNNAAVETVKTGLSHSYRAIRFDIVHDNAGRWLNMVLPNNRRLWYKNPRIEMCPMPWDHRDERPQVEFDGLNQKGVWTVERLYGGVLTENAVQAISRDIMVEAMIRVEIAGYKVILTIHDEVISEVLKTFGSLKEFESLMKVVPAHLPGCPIGVEGWRGYRYKK